MWSGGQVSAGAPIWRLKFIELHKVDPVVIAVHGGDVNGRWCFFPKGESPVDAEAVIFTVLKQNPGREILVVACNASHHTVRMSHVWYAKEAVWSIPHPDGWYVEEDGSMLWCVGDIREFVEGTSKSP